MNERTLTKVNWAAILPLGAMVSLAGCGGPPPGVQPFPKLGVKITQFYTSTPKVSQGEQATICYGVENAASVRIEPAVDELHPAIARCFQFDPARRALYKLIARGKDGDETFQTLTIELAGARPVFLDLHMSATEVKAGDPVRFCFKAANATSVRGGPGIFLKGGRAAGDCLEDRPARTTTYRLTVANRDGVTDTDEITVHVKGN